MGIERAGIVRMGCGSYVNGRGGCTMSGGDGCT